MSDDKKIPDYLVEEPTEWRLSPAAARVAQRWRFKKDSWHFASGANWCQVCGMWFIGHHVCVEPEEEALTHPGR